MRESILVQRGFLLAQNSKVNDYSKYYAAKLLNTFGVLVDKPNEVTENHVRVIERLFGTDISRSFYNNPQDIRYFTVDELILEQVISYFSIENITGMNSENESDFDRIELFKKALPKYQEGKEVTFRNYRIITEFETRAILKEICDNLCSYTRKWNENEEEEFHWLFENHFYDGKKVESKDNALLSFISYEKCDFAKCLDQKDVVKLSVLLKGESKQLDYTRKELETLRVAIKNCQSAKLSKKQAKYYNTIVRHINKSCNEKIKKDNHLRSPYKIAKDFLKQNKVVEAAKVFAKNGSLLERNLVWLLSRANLQEAQEIIDLIKVNNPIVSIQFVNGLLKDDNDARVFKFTRDRKVVKHVETDYERKWRKSILSFGIKKALKEGIEKKIEDYYKSLPSFGRVYINDSFKKIALPLNTSATGGGLDVLPIGSRIPIKGDYIRTFCYWNDAFDIDTSVLFENEKTNTYDALYWGSYSLKPFGNSALHSGDVRGQNGAEYIDFKISELRQKGYKYGYYYVNGYNDRLNKGKIYCGYQNKDDLHTIAWDSKNIAMKIQVHGDSRSFLGFAIDLETNEIIIINQMIDSDEMVVKVSDLLGIKYLLNKDYLDNFNVYNIAKLRGELVDSPNDADVVFDDKYVPLEGQKVIKSSDIEKLVNILTK